MPTSLSPYPFHTFYPQILPRDLWVCLVWFTTVTKNGVLFVNFFLVIGWLHLKLVEKANESNVVLPESNRKPGIGAAIERLGGNASE